jgi:DNA-binding CsgD family transcriptional regulator
VSEDAEHVWRCLLLRPAPDLETLTQRVGSDDGAVGGALEELIDLGLVRSGPDGLHAVDPALAIETHLARAERRMAAKAEQIAVLRAALPDFSGMYREGRLHDTDVLGWEVIAPLEEIRRQVYSAAERATSDIRSLDPGIALAGADALAMKDAERIQYDTLARGVRDRTIVDDRALDDPYVFAEWGEIHRRGGQVRTAPRVSTRVTIFDHELALIALEATDSHAAVAIRSRSVIDILIYLFDQLWPQTIPLFSLPEDSGVPTGRPSRVLELMMAGMKDERIARALGVRPRTVRRDIAQLRAALGVSSRTEIVTAAAKRGWL